MNIEAAEIELCLRQYQWALKDFQREYEEGYALLRSLPLPGIQSFLIYVDRFPASEQVKFVRAIMKSSHRSALAFMGEKFSEEDEARVNTYLKEIRSMVAAAVSNTISDSVSNTPSTKTFAVKRTDVAKTVLPALSSAVGAKPEKFASLHWFYTIPVGDWRFYTELDFSGTWGTEVRCYHRLVRNDSRSRGFVPMTLQMMAGPVQISQVFSLSSLYGLPGHTYYIHSPAHVSDAIKAIIVSYNHLFHAIPDWIDRLTT
jgi:hypothetical protein